MEGAPFVEVQHDPERVIKRTVKGFIRSPSGRDSFLRTIQYILRLILLYRLRTRPPKPSFKPSRSIQTSFAIVSLLSALRRILTLQTIIQSIQRLPNNTNPFRSLTQKGHPPGQAHSKSRQTSTEYLFELSRSCFDLVAVITDNIYLGSRLGVIPKRYIDQRRAKRIDQISDLCALASVLVGFLQVETKKTRLKSRGNEKRMKTLRLEKELEELEFWQEGGGSGETGRVRSQEQVEEERKLREKVRVERGKLRRMREELGGMKWEKWRLSAEGVFAVYDVLDLQIGREVAKSWSGVTASLIEASQAWTDYVRG
ncbi:uncharacterized protein JCM6883_003540 [Sporobolomyces salmoneus]|uniref:uncharacterized protein n=1 Tax=Sporobolomyces salmoneus TaxID=183962 RepID=UPI0031775572